MDQIKAVDVTKKINTVDIRCLPINLTVKRPSKKKKNLTVKRWVGVVNSQFPL